jgi:hypothetical protein
MSVIVHRCRECGHNDLEHNEQPYKGRTCSLGWCTCSQVKAQVVTSPSEVIPSWSADDGSLITKAHEPGSKVHLGGPVTVALCGCAACVAVFTGAVS